METRPKIQVELSRMDKTVETTSKALLLLMWGFTLYAFVKLPVIVPIHFNASGEADAHGSKATLFILPCVATFFYFLLSYINKYPHFFAYKTGITEQNAQQQYGTATAVLRFLKLVILLLFSFITLFVYLITIGASRGLGGWFLPFTILLLLVPAVASTRQFWRRRSP